MIRLLLWSFDARLQKPLVKIDGLDRWTRTPFMWAVLNGHVEAAACLLAHGSYVNGAKAPLTFHQHSTSLLMEQPLHMACRLPTVKAVAMVDLLIRSGANLDIQNQVACIALSVLLCADWLCRSIKQRFTLCARNGLTSTQKRKRKRGVRVLKGWCACCWMEEHRSMCETSSVAVRSCVHWRLDEWTSPCCFFAFIEVCEGE